MPYSGLPRVGGITERFKNNVKINTQMAITRSSFLLLREKQYIFVRGEKQTTKNNEVNWC